MQNGNKEYAIGVDIGGTKMEAVLFDGEKVIADYKLSTPKDDLDHFFVMLMALIDPLKKKAEENGIEIKGIGLGVAGTIDYDDNKVLGSPNLPIINGVKMVNILRDRIGLKIKMDNDANCFVYAEALMGAGKKYKNVFGVTVGTGIGGAWCNNGEVYLGAHGGASEPSAMVIDFKSGIGLEEAYHKLTQNNPASLAEEAYRGDELALKTFAEVGYDLGVAFANIVNLIDPEVFVVGGGVAKSSDLFLPYVKKPMRKFIKSDESRKRVKIVKGKLGEQAGAIGAALLFMDRE